MKNFKYSNKAKLIAYVLLLIFSIPVALSGIYLSENSDTILSKHYYDTTEFKTEFEPLIAKALSMNLMYTQLNDDSTQIYQFEKKQLDKRIKSIQNELNKYVNFYYYIENSMVKGYFTNFFVDDAIKMLKKQSTLIYINEFKTDKLSIERENIHEMLKGTPYNIYAAVVDKLIPGDAFYELAQKFHNVKVNYPYILPVFIVSMLVVITLFIYLVSVTGRKEKKGIIAKLLNDRIFTDIYTVAMLIIYAISYQALVQFSYKLEVLIPLIIVFSIDVLLGVSYALSMIRQILTRTILKNTLVYKIYLVIKRAAAILRETRVLKGWFIILLLLYGFINGFLIIQYDHNPGFLVLLLIFTVNAFAVGLVIKWSISLAKIINAVKEISSGNIDYEFDTSKISLTFLAFAQSIKSLGQGLNKAVSEAVKAERMRTDLITNVSHDLKTPLTSIINYVDLLKNEVPCSSKSQEYLAILEEKSARLKVLIEDLMEASKVSSGNIAVNLDNLDLNQLMIQALGEFQEKLEASSLEVILESKEKNVFILADGRHMWRVAENLLSNVVKYSMPNTRVYISIEKKTDKGVLTIKNISKVPLNISPEQLTERFVRGDESRTTEGSGLGLSIAQSLVKVQNSNLEIEIDGDLFKVTVEMPLITE